MTGSIVIKCDIPTISALDRATVERAWFSDSYKASLSKTQSSVIDNFFAIFGHRPVWMNRILILRNRIAKLCGLEVATDTQVINAQIAEYYAVGDTIGPWPIFALSETELIAGRNNGHLDFRLSVLRVPDGMAGSVIVSTVCTVHNLFGKIYLFFIIPFHKWGVQKLITNAAAAGRL